MVALVSFVFSTFIYKTVTYELENSFVAAEAKVRSQALFVARKPVLEFLSEDLARAKRQVLLRLLMINGAILIISAAGGYFLAGKALYPIELAMNEQKRFVSDASHELRTPLTSLKTEMEVALRDKKLKTKDARQLITSNLEEVEKMQQLTNYLLACSHYGVACSPIPKKKFQIKDVVENAIRKVSPAASQKDIKIKKEVKANWVRANSASIEELLVILLDNAIKYSREGGQVFIRAVDDKRHLIFEVKDSGVGIKASHIPYIFNRFYRADQSRSKQKTDGYGLGLAIAKGIVEAHKGEIKVKSKPDVGSTFSIVLPK